DPLAVALQYIHADWAAGILALGAVAAMTSVLLVFQLGQARIFMSMARDGLLPPWAARVHPRYKTPHITTIITGVFVAVSAAFAPIGWVLELTNIGTLFAFVLVALGIIVLRRREPDRPRPFRTPWVPVLPLVSAAFCLYLMINLPLLTWVRFGLWMAFVPLVFASLTLGVAGLGDIRKIGRVGGRTIAYFLVSTAISATIGLILVNLVQPGVGLDPALVKELLETYRAQAQGLQAGGGGKFGVDMF